MLFPVLQFVLLWWTGCLMECHGSILMATTLLVLGIEEANGFEKQGGPFCPAQ
jgi:hypothetical protein